MILVVEDEKNILKVVTYNLEREGYQVSVAKDGEEALAKARRELPDLVILDLMLPKVDGLEVCRQLRVEVEDTGIPAEDLPRVFERFYRVDKARSRETGGTGLGLSIVKHVAETHAGSVCVESQPGRGSLFTLTIPL